MRYVKLKYHFLVLNLFLGLLVSCGVKKGQKDRPDVNAYPISIEPRIRWNDSLYFKGDNSLRKNQYGQWELVASGNPLELGNTIGDLSQELIKKQEEIFFSMVEELVPSRSKQYLLRKFLAWYNRQMYLHVKEEYKIEILGISKYTSDEYDYIADKYLRTMYLHSAHDIGHAMQDLALVGCSSFAVWGENTADGNLLVARNFDFYAGDEFSKEKVISFIDPDEGYKFMSVSWAGMIGVMSGMNNKGLTVTINAGKSDVPLIAKTPISLVAREIVQYASNINEAIEIAKRKEIFVSESILIGSAADNKAVIIEMSPDNFGVYEVENTSKLICSNHFQSEAYQLDDNNLEQIANSHSQYRYDRMEELLGKSERLTAERAVAILRNTKGMGDKDIGYGNEKALNQLLAHHGIIFEPKKKMVWVSANPYQLGEFVAFQLDSVFLHSKQKVISLSENDALIAKDSFIDTQTFFNYEEYRKEKRNIQQIIDENSDYNSKDINRFISLNPESWEVYYLTGKYFYNRKYYKAALIQFEKALSKEITTVPDRKAIENYIKKINKRINDS
jgi:predicted choloylglycine hydrolase